MDGKLGGAGKAPTRCGPFQPRKMRASMGPHLQPGLGLDLAFTLFAFDEAVFTARAFLPSLDPLLFGAA